MAEENKIIWPEGSAEIESVQDFEWLMAGKTGQPLRKIHKDKYKNYLSITGIEMKPVATGSLPLGPSGQERKMIIQSAGVWTYGGNNFVNPVGEIMTLWWNGTTWSVADRAVLPVGKDGREITEWEPKAYAFSSSTPKVSFLVFKEGIIRENNATTLSTDIPGISPKWVKKAGTNVSGTVIKDGTKAVSQGGVFIELYGGDRSQFGLNVNEFTANASSGIHTVIFTEIFKEETQILKVIIYAFTAGKIALKTFTTKSLVATPKTEHEITLVAGINTIDVSNLNIKIPTGGQYGYSANSTTRLGRVGYKNIDERANYHITGVETMVDFTMQPKPSIGGFGFDIQYKTKGLANDFKVTKNRGDIVSKFFTQLGNIVPDYTSGALRLQFTTGNQSVIAKGVLPVGKLLNVRLSGRVITGSLTNVTIGVFASVLNPPITNRLIFNTSIQVFEFQLESSLGDVSIGLISSANSGQLIEITNFEIVEVSTLKDIDTSVDQLTKLSEITPQSFYLDSAFFGINRFDKKCTVAVVVGDSLNANPIGGLIPDLEAVTRRPIRLNSGYTLSRRLYDYLSWNKPQWRRLDDVDWTKEGTWSTNGVECFEPNYDVYNASNVGGSSAEIRIPMGHENFALVCRVGKSSGVIEIYLNGIIHTSINTLKESAGHTGNPFKTINIIGMPSEQVNIIRIVNKVDNVNPIYVWGGYYWTGNTFVVYNAAHGMHTLEQLLEQHMDDEVVDNRPDCVLFQHTLMNDTARITDAGNTLARSKVALTTIIDEKLKGKDIIMMSCQPYGKIPSNPSVNYYNNYPGMEHVKNALKTITYQKGLPYIDVFDIFKKMTENRGGALENGEGGTWYTHDGQHQNPIGMELYWSMIKPFLKKLPIKD